MTLVAPAAGAGRRAERASGQAKLDFNGGRVLRGRMRTLFAFTALALAAACTGGQPSAPDAAPVIAAERAFAAEAGRTGWVEAFIAHSSDEAIVIGARPENAHQSLAAIDPANLRDTSLVWGPVFAGMSRGGDIGFTTGPYAGGGTAFGQYFTVWRKQPDGSWKWIYDGGTNQRAAQTVDANAEVAQIEVGARGAGSAAAAVAAVRLREESLAQAAASNAGQAFSRLMAEHGRMNRDDQPSAIGPEAAAALAGTGPVGYSPPQTIEAGAAGDLVFTLGQARWQGGSGYYCRIWVLQRDGWRIAFDQILQRPLDAPAAPEDDPPAP